MNTQKSHHLALSDVTVHTVEAESGDNKGGFCPAVNCHLQNENKNSHPCTCLQVFRQPLSVDTYDFKYSI